VVITFKGQDVVEHKFNITGATAGGQCVITRAPKQVKINTPSTFQMQARDRMGNVMTTGGETFKSSVSGVPGGVSDFKVCCFLTFFSSFFFLSFSCFRAFLFPFFSILFLSEFVCLLVCDLIS
jgi:hypothetical protein